MATKYAWGDGLGKVHSIPLAQHKTNAKTNVKKAKLNAPIVPGSTITERQLARQVNAAAKINYGPRNLAEQQGVQQSKNFARDIGGPGGFYDQYLAKLGQHTQNIAGIGQVANQAMMGLQQGVTGLAGQTLAPIQAQADQGAAARGVAPAGDLTPMASNAAAVRQALVGSFIADQTARNAAAQAYADTQANVVGPGQKLSGQAIAQGKTRQAQAKRQQTAGEIGAFKYKTGEDIRSSESKNVLAGKIAGFNVAKAADAAAETKRSHQANESLSQQRINAANAKTRADAIKAGKLSPSEQKTNAELAYFRKHGYWPPTGPPKTGKGSGTGADGKGGPKLITQNELGARMTNLGQLKDLAKKAMGGAPFVTGHAKQPKLSRQAANRKILEFAGKDIKDPLLLTAAQDAVRLGRIGLVTERSLRAAGYPVDRVARTLGVPTTTYLHTHMNVQPNPDNR